MTLYIQVVVYRGGVRSHENVPASVIYGSFRDYLIDHSGRKDELGVILNPYDGGAHYVGVMVFGRDQDGNIMFYHPLPGLDAYTELDPLLDALAQYSQVLDSSGDIVWLEQEIPN